MAYERIEGDNIVVPSQSGDNTNVAFQRIEPGASVSGTVLFRVRDGLADGTAITITPDYFCETGICNANLVQVQVHVATARSLASTDERQELLVAPASGGPDTVFRFSIRKFPYRDTVELWLGSDTGGIRQLPQQYQVGSDGGKASFASADTVSVAAGATVADINAILSLGGQIAGRVTTDSGGTGLPGGVVIAFASCGGIGAIALTDATGAYETPGLAPGVYTLLFDPTRR